MNNLSVAIDGPSGAGKSTIARAVAEKLGYTYVDTGAMYRAIGLAVSRRAVACGDTQGILHILPTVDITLQYENGAQHVLLCGEDVSEQIRTPQAAKYASCVSALPAVRQFLLELQRSMAARGNVIMDGRDIGTVILPNAAVKIYLTASVECRAKRRFEELLAKGQTVTLQSVLQDIQSRDEKDMNRAASPLRQAEDAVLLDSSALSLEQAIESVLHIIKERTKEL